MQSKPDEREQISRELKAAGQEQRQIIQQISGRAVESRSHPAALDDLFDRIEEHRADVEARLNQAPAEEDFEGRSGR